MALKGAVDRGARDREDVGEVADAVVAGVVHAPQLAGLSGGEFRFLAAELALGAGDGHPLAGRMRIRSLSNSAKVARMLKNIFPMGSFGS